MVTGLLALMQLSWGLRKHCGSVWERHGSRRASPGELHHDLRRYTKAGVWDQPFSRARNASSSMRRAWFSAVSEATR